MENNLTFEKGINEDFEVYDKDEFLGFINYNKEGKKWQLDSDAGVSLDEDFLREIANFLRKLRKNGSKTNLS